MPDDDYTRRELLDKWHEYHVEIVGLMDKTNDEVQILKAATASLNSSKQTPFWKKILFGAAVVVCTMFVLMILARVTGYCEVSFTTEGGGFKRCEQ